MDCKETNLDRQCMNATKAGQETSLEVDNA